MSGIFQRWSGMSVGPSTLRSSFITYLLGGDGDSDFGELNDSRRQQFAYAMRHSVNHVRHNIVTVMYDTLHICICP